MWYGTLLRCILNTDVGASLSLFVYVQADSSSRCMAVNLPQCTSNMGIAVSVLIGAC